MNALVLVTYAVGVSPHIQKSVRREIALKGVENTIPRGLVEHGMKVRLRKPRMVSLTGVESRVEASSTGASLSIILARHLLV